MDDTAARDLALTALKVLKPLALLSKKPKIEAHFRPSEKFSDSYILGRRKGNWFFGASPHQPFIWLSINITLRPGQMSSQWFGFTIDIEQPETKPHINFAREWPEAGGEFNIPSDHFEDLKPYIAELVETPLTADNKPAPREAPASMF